MLERASVELRLSPRFKSLLEPFLPKALRFSGQLKKGGISSKELLGIQEKMAGGL